MDTETLVVINAVIGVIALLLAYVLIRFGVKHGTRSALREHEVWMRDGSLEAALDAHAAELAEDQAIAARNEAAKAATRQ